MAVFEVLTMRVQLEIPDNRIRQLEATMKLMGFKTKTELFNNSLTLLGFVSQECD